MRYNNLVRGLCAVLASAILYSPLEANAVDLNMKVSPRGTSFVAQYESFSAKPYKEPNGSFSVGYGHQIKPGENLPSVTREQAETLLKNDLRIAENAVKNSVRVPLNQNQFDALVSFTYNVGSGNLQRSTLVRKLNAEDYSGASEEFKKWSYAQGKKLKGLEVRREAERDLFVGSR